jgi:rRNA processing protein Krr1/Pno1
LPGVSDHAPVSHIHILGSVQNIKIARDAIVSLILGSPPGMSCI